MLQLLFIVAVQALLAAIGLWVTTPPPHLRHLPRAPFISSLLTFITKPILEAMELVYWPTIFEADFMATWFLGSWWVAISDPDVIRSILTDTGLGEKKLFTDLSPHALIGEYMGVNVLYSKGAEWRKHQRIIAPAFRKDWPVAKFFGCAQLMLERVDKDVKTSIDVHELFTAMTLDALGHAVLGIDFGATCNPLASPYTKSYHRAARAVAEFRCLVSKVLHQKREEIKDGSHKDDLLSRLLLAEGAVLGDREIINNAVVMFAAGHDTSANTLSFTLYHLSTNPGVQERAREEVAAVLGSTTTPTQEQLSRLVYLDAVIMESMRLTPTLPQLRRELKRSLQLPDGTSLPRGTLVLLQTYSAMNHPKHWERPNEFNPARFLTFSEATSTWHPNFNARSRFFGFGGGSRACIGQNMAILEQRVALSAILRNYRIQLPPDSPHKVRLITNQDPVCRPVDLRLDFIRI
ncbi:hypothetical protein L0F63_005226 [Massospora cicadina]|nr:hypothetical protein L0F63_005226 [Massospora cicadina]